MISQAGARGALTTVVGLVLPFVGLTAARADGTLPPQPYHYLHPPPAIAGSNTPPDSGDVYIPARAGQSLGGFGFTGDGQAGITTHVGAFRVSPAATVVHIKINPVETPPGLPAQVAADGNSYNITAVGQPGNASARLAKKVDLTFRWPHIPLAMYVYRNGSWRQLCYSDTAVLTPSTIGCSTSTLGTFVVVTNPSNIRSGVPTTPVSSTRFAWINRYIPLLAALLAVVAALVVAYFVSRPDKVAKSND